MSKLKYEFVWKFIQDNNLLFECYKQINIKANQDIMIFEKIWCLTKEKLII